jgi:hypothetical protein
MNESEKRFSFTRAASSKSGRAQKQFPISLNESQSQFSFTRTAPSTGGSEKSTLLLSVFHKARYRRGGLLRFVDRG